MKIEQKLLIGNLIYNVTEVDDSELNNSLGETNTIKQTIKIDKNLSQNHKEQVLIHEIMHACNDVFGESEMSHLFLDSFAKQLYQVLKDNKLLN